VTKQRKSAKSIEKEAADWAARLDGRALSQAEAVALESWLAGDSRCLGAFARARALMLSPLSLAALEAPRSRLAPHLPRRGFLALAAGGMLAAALVYERQERVEPKLFASEIGEIRKIQLEDGSRITLNTDSRLSVEYRRDLRQVTLLRGEAYFEVAKNPDRPFTVVGPKVQARAVGTAYSVRLADGETPMQIRVLEGRVAVEPPPSLFSRGGSRALLGANQEAQLRISDKGDIELLVRDLPADQFERGLMWREGLLSFEGATLQEAIAEFSRYSRQKISLKGGIAREKISGLFSATDPAGFSRAVAIGLKIKIKNENDEIILYK